MFKEDAELFILTISASRLPYCARSDASYLTSCSLVVAFTPKVLGEPVSAGSMLTVGVAVELFMFILFWVLTAVYVRRANTEFDALKQQLIEECK